MLCRSQRAVARAGVAARLKENCFSSIVACHSHGQRGPVPAGDERFLRLHCWVLGRPVAGQRGVPECLRSDLCRICWYGVIEYAGRIRWHDGCFSGSAALRYTAASLGPLW